MNPIHWYPGHMAKTQRMLEEQIKRVDAVAELLDARIPCAGRNPQLEELRKPRLLLLNRVDQADPHATALWIEHFRSQGHTVLPLDSKSGAGCRAFAPAARKLLEEKIEGRAARGQVGRAVRLMVVGIPNVGKSSFINRVAGKNSAKVENRPGVTRDKQWIVVAGGIELLDTPGILWPKLEDQESAKLLAFTGAIRDQILDEESLAAALLSLLAQHYPQALAQRYKVEGLFDGPALLEAVAKKRGMLAPGGKADTERAAPLVLGDFRGGKLGRITLEKPGDAGDPNDAEDSES